MCYELPARKLQDILEGIRGMIRKQKTTRRELLSLIGKLVHACRRLPPGRGFMRRLLDAAYSVSQPQHRVRVTQAIRADLRWWDEFGQKWNGEFPMLPPAAGVGPEVYISTDSSRTGMGAV